MDKQFYEYETDEERVSNVYSKFTIQQLWDFWTNKESKIMEIRIMDFNLIKEISDNFNLPWSASGVYIKDVNELKTVIKYTRDKAVMWFGINRRKKNWSKWKFKIFGGTDHFIDSIDFIFIDIDRINKNNTFATQEDLRNCNKLLDLVLEKLGEYKWNNKYMRICSGNGVQCILPLDIPIKIPNTIYDNEKKIYIDNEEFIKVKQLIREGIGKQIVNFCNKYKKELNVEIDDSVFKLSVVGALPATKNYKYNGFRWRGITEIKDNGINEGLSDYCLQYIDNIEQFKQINPFSTNKQIRIDKRIKPGELLKDPLVQFLMNTENLPTGVNNTIWFQCKILIRNSKYDMSSKEFIEFHETIKRKHGRTFTLNIPDEKMEFNEEAVNNYCIENGFKPIYPLWSKKTKFLNLIDMTKIKWENLNSVTKSLQLSETSTILDDLTNLKNLFEPKSYKNIEITLMFLKGSIQKYGETKAKYYFENIYDKFLNYE